MYLNFSIEPGPRVSPGGTSLVSVSLNEALKHLPSHGDTTGPPMPIVVFKKKEVDGPQSSSRLPPPISMLWLYQRFQSHRSGIAARWECATNARWGKLYNPLPAPLEPRSGHPRCPSARRAIAFEFVWYFRDSLRR